MEVDSPTDQSTDADLLSINFDFILMPKDLNNNWDNIYWIHFFFYLANGRSDQGAKAKADNESDEDRGDLIQFYNSVYVLKMQSFALKYAHPSADSSVRTLSLK